MGILGCGDLRRLKISFSCKSADKSLSNYPQFQIKNLRVRMVGWEGRKRAVNCYGKYQSSSALGKMNFVKLSQRCYSSSYVMEIEIEK